MFNENDRVIVKDSRAVGTVLETYDDMVCVELDNGVEMEYNVNQLMTQDEFNRQEDEQVEAMLAKRKPGLFTNVPYVPRRGDGRSAANVIAAIREIYPDILLDAEDKAGRPPKDDLDRVRVLSEFTGTPMIVWLGSGEMNDKEMIRRVLAKTVLNNIGSDSGMVCDMLLAKCRRVLAEYNASEA